MILIVRDWQPLTFSSSDILPSVSILDGRQSSSYRRKWIDPLLFIIPQYFRVYWAFWMGCAGFCMCEKCLHTEVFLVRIFPYSVRIRENTDQKKLRFWTLFTQYILLLQERRSLNPCQHIKAINYCCQVLYRRCFAVVLVNLSMRWTSQ